MTETQKTSQQQPVTTSKRKSTAILKYNTDKQMGFNEFNDIVDVS